MRADDVARRHRLFAFFHLAAYTGARRGQAATCARAMLGWARPSAYGSGSAAVIGGTRIEGTAKSGRSRTVRVRRPKQSMC